MNRFHTIDEKSIEWKLSTRTIQALCRSGKIEGAVKRAGSWFIPAEAFPPGQTDPAEQRYLFFGGTKQKIFDAAVELFSSRSYDLVSIKDIAAAAGIRQSAVYNHFASKQVMLDTIYEFYRHYFLSTRPSIESLEPVLRQGSLGDILGSVVYDFEKGTAKSMLCITKIILGRKFHDETAKEIYRDIILEEGLRYCEAVFDRAVAIGRIAPFDTHLMAVMCSGARLYVLLNWIAGPETEHQAIFLEDQRRMIEQAALSLTDLGKLPLEPT